MAGTAPLDSHAEARHAAPAAGDAFRSLVDADPDLVAGIPASDSALARRALMRPVHAIPPGPWKPESLWDAPHAVGVLLLDGAVARQLDLADRHCTEVLGPGDVIGATPSSGLIDVPVTWAALQPTACLVLDGRFTLAAQRWPSLTVNLHRRLLGQAHRSAVHAAIAQLPRVERRVLALLWQLAERFGRVTPAGVEVDLELTHEAIGRLVGAQRPTVSLALADLAREEAVVRTVRRTWLLSSQSRDLLARTDS